MKKGIIAVLILLFFTSSVHALDIFRPNIKFGMSKQDVIKTETNLKVLQNFHTILIMGPIDFFGRPGSNLDFMFQENTEKLLGARYEINLAGLSISDCFELHNKLMMELEESFGKAAEKASAQIPDNMETRDKNLLNGALDVRTLWMQQDTHILLSFFAENAKPRLTLMYYSPNMAQSHLQASVTTKQEMEIPFDLKFGMSKDQVKKDINAQPAEETADSLTYVLNDKSSETGVLIVVINIFSNNKLEAVYFVNQIPNLSPEQYIQAYQEFKERYIKTYDKPMADNISWLDPKKTAIVENPAQALMHGEASFNSLWAFDSGEMLTFQLVNSANNILLSTGYLSKTHIEKSNTLLK